MDPESHLVIRAGQTVHQPCSSCVRVDAAHEASGSRARGSILHVDLDQGSSRGRVWASRRPTRRCSGPPAPRRPTGEAESRGGVASGAKERGGHSIGGPRLVRKQTSHHLLVPRSCSRSRISNRRGSMRFELLVIGRARSPRGSGGTSTPREARTSSPVRARRPSCVSHRRAEDGLEASLPIRLRLLPQGRSAAARATEDRRAKGILRIRTEPMNDVPENHTRIDGFSRFGTARPQPHCGRGSTPPLSRGRGDRSRCSARLSLT